MTNIIFVGLYCDRVSVKHIKQEHQENTDFLDQGSSLLSHYPDPDLECQHSDPEHPKKLINCSMYNYRTILEISSKSTNIFWSNDWIFDWAINMLIQIATRI